MIQALFFDFNGVIINDERLSLAAYQGVLRQHGLELTEADYFAALGMDDERFVRAAFARAQKELPLKTMEAVLHEKTVAHRKLIEEELPLCHGVVTFLKATSRKYSLGLVSMAGREEIDYVLSRARLHGLFSIVISAADVEACKPAPDCYQRALEKLDAIRFSLRLPSLSPSECLVIEDSPPGIQSGRAAGMKTLGVTNTVSENELRAADADVVTHSLADWTVDSVRHVFN
jgi:beta-phosphoglucomutase